MPFLVLSVIVGLTSGQGCHRRESCNNHGCHHYHSGCSCFSGYSGSRCEVDVCQHIDCNGHGQCSHTQSSPYWQCSCDNGYHGDTCQDDLCQNQHCSGHGHCSHISSAPYWKCTCNHGYEGEHCHVDVCQHIDCNGHGQCTHTQSSPYWQCSCDNGYHGDTCQDDVCQNQQCGGNGQCIPKSSAPYWQCTCDNGYQGDTCQDDLCKNEQCSGNGHCSLTSSSPYWACTCNNGYLGDTCQYQAFRNCSDVDVVSDIVMKKYSTNMAATFCSTGNTNSPEAFVLNYCSVTQQTTSWHQGAQVMSSANCSAIPMYTPVAMFTSSQYSPSFNDNVAGVFVGCLQGGFKLAVQQCAEPPQIVHINSTSTADPNMFYTIT